MNEEPRQPLPPWRTVFTDRSSWRIWKRLIQRAGKQQVFELLEFKLRELAPGIRNRDHSASDNQRSISPLVRKMAIIEAFDEIRSGRDPVVACAIASNPGTYAHGVVGDTSFILSACVHLLKAMCAKKGFEQSILHCLSILSTYLGAEAFVNQVGAELQNRTDRPD